MREKEQQEVCGKYGAPFLATASAAIAGVARNLMAAGVPVNGLRHPSVDGTSGWYIWAGDYSEADDFFEPTHVAHLEDICPQITKFLGLAPGWRFLVAEGHVDVWYDDTLLVV